MWNKARALVQERIKGHRKGTNRPAYMHSVHVSERLREQGYSDEVCLAGLLHDIVEDGGVSLNELSEMGFSDRVVQLVSLCTHDASMKNRDARWVKMVARLIDASDKEAWAIKLADVEDNIKDSDSMKPERAKFLKDVKEPLLKAVSKDAFDGVVLRGGRFVDKEAAENGDKIIAHLKKLPMDEIY